METTKKISNGDLTNQGLVKMVDKNWNHKDGSPADCLVITENGLFRESELVVVPKAIKKVVDMKPLTGYDTVMNVDIRPGRVVSAARVPKTDKLIHLKVETAFGVKNAVTNLGAKFSPVDFIGHTFMFVMNMVGVNMRGVDSEVMIIAETRQKFISETNEYVEDVQLIPINMSIDSTIL